MQDKEPKPDYAQSIELILEQRAATLQLMREALQTIRQALLQLSVITQTEQNKLN